MADLSNNSVLGVGNSNIFYFHPEPCGNDPIWRAYFSKGLVQPPTRLCQFKKEKDKIPHSPNVLVAIFLGGQLWSALFFGELGPLVFRPHRGISGHIERYRNSQDLKLQNLAVSRKGTVWKQTRKFMNLTRFRWKESCKFPQRWYHSLEEHCTVQEYCSEYRPLGPVMHPSMPDEYKVPPVECMLSFSTGKTSPVVV